MVSENKSLLFTFSKRNSKLKLFNDQNELKVLWLIFEGISSLPFSLLKSTFHFNIPVGCAFQTIPSV